MGALKGAQAPAPETEEHGRMSGERDQSPMWQKEVSSYTFLGMGEVSQQEPTARLSDSWAGGREGVWELEIWPSVSL